MTSPTEISRLDLPLSHHVNVLNILKFQLTVRIVFVAAAIGHVGHGVDFGSRIENDQLEALIDVGIGDLTQQVDVVVARAIGQTRQRLTRSSDRCVRFT